MPVSSNGRAARLQRADLRFDSSNGYVPLTGQAKRDYARAWKARRRKTWFEDKVCIQCGSTENLELDHVNPTDKISHKIWSWSAPRREAELAKCQVLCHDCHEIKSNKEKAFGERNGRSLLKEKDIPAIRASTESRKALAEKYGVDLETIKTVRARRSWKHVPLFMVTVA